MCDISCLASNSAKVFFSIETCSQWCWPVTNICILYFKIDLYMYYILLCILENTDMFLCMYIFIMCIFLVFSYFTYIFICIYVCYIYFRFVSYVFHIIMHAWALRCIFSRSSFHLALSFFPMALSLYKHKTCTKKNTKTCKDNSFKICTIVQFRLLAIDSL